MGIKVSERNGIEVLTDYGIGILQQTYGSNAIVVVRKEGRSKDVENKSFPLSWIHYRSDYVLLYCMHCGGWQHAQAQFFADESDFNTVIAHAPVLCRHQYALDLGKMSFRISSTTVQNWGGHLFIRAGLDELRPKPFKENFQLELADARATWDTFRHCRLEDNDFEHITLPTLELWVTLFFQEDWDSKGGKIVDWKLICFDRYRHSMVIQQRTDEKAILFDRSRTVA